MVFGSFGPPYSSLYLGAKYRVANTAGELDREGGGALWNFSSGFVHSKARSDCHDNDNDKQ